MQRSGVAMLGFACAVALLGARPASAKDKLVMGVHPYKPSVELHKMFRPIADYVSRKLGVPVELQFGKSYEDAAEKVGTGQFDFSFLGPNVYAKFGPRYQLKPLAQIVNDGKPSFYGVIVTKKGSPIRSLRDLKGRSFAFGDRNSTLTHVVPLYMLLGENVRVADLKKVAFLGSHDNLALNVLAGTFDAAGLMPDIAAKYEGLQVIATSPQLPEHVFVASASVDAALFATIQDALLTMDASLLKRIKGSVTGIQKVHERDFDLLREIMEVAEREEK
jgi:phosphonate transport system substrate-binding protein